MSPSDPTLPSFAGPRRVLRRRRRLILSCVALAVAVAVVNVAAQPKQYTATVDLLLRDPGIDEKLFEGMGGRPTDPNREARTDIVLVSSRDVAARVAKRLGRSVDDVEDSVTVAPEGLSNVVHVSVEEEGRDEAARTATLFAEEFIARRREVEVERIEEVQGRLRERLAALPQDAGTARLLREQAEELELLAATQTGDAEIVGPPDVPAAATSPKPVRDVFLAAVLGFLLGLGAAFAAERLDRRLRDAEEAEALLDGELLVTVRPPDPDGWALLWAALAHRRDAPRTIAVTSPSAADGALEVAWGIVSAAADAGRDAVLVEAGLRAPRAAAELGLGEGDEATELEGFGPSFAEELEELAQEIESAPPAGADGDST